MGLITYGFKRRRKKQQTAGIDGFRAVCAFGRPGFGGIPVAMDGPFASLPHRWRCGDLAFDLYTGD